MLPQTQPARMSTPDQREQSPNGVKRRHLDDARGVRTAESARMAKASKLGIPTGNVRIQLSQLKRLKTSTESLRLLIWSAAPARFQRFDHSRHQRRVHSSCAHARSQPQKNIKRIGGMISATCVETISNPRAQRSDNARAGGDFFQLFSVHNRLISPYGFALASFLTRD